MSKSLLLPVLVFLLSLISTSGPTLAQELVKMEAEGWRVMKDGVLQRELRAGETETFVYGVEGFTWKLQDLRNHLRKLRALFQSSPTPELREVIRSHRKEIERTLQAIQRARVAEAGGLTGIAKSSCFNQAFSADAGSRTDVQGTWASANASFSAPPGCSATGEVYAHATASAWMNGAPVNESFTDGHRYGSSVSASASARVSGGSPCNSLGLASVTTYNTPNPSSQYKEVENDLCPVPPPLLQVSVTSTHASSIDFYPGMCLQIAWSVSVANGTSPYTIKIYLNNVFKKNGTSHWEWICMPAGGGTHNFILRADVTDSSGNTGSGSHTTTIY